MTTDKTVPRIEQQIEELKAAGWVPVRHDLWKAPIGGYFLGPHGAWLAMKRSEMRDTGIDSGPALPHPRVLDRAYRRIEEKYPKPMATEDEKQKYFEEGYDQCYREVIEEIETWNHPDKKSFIAWLSKTFKLSAEKMTARR
jgi:hypothetical protein